MTAPSIEDARAMGAKGSPPTESERLAFEAWMEGHCWVVLADWNGKEYVGSSEKGHGYGVHCPHASEIRRMWAAWRDRAALTPKSEVMQHPNNAVTSKG